MKSNAIAILILALSCLPIAASEPGKAIPFDQLGAAVEKQSPDNGTGITPTATGAKLRAVMQDLEAEATPDGLWLTSTADEDAGKPNRFRIRATAAGRQGQIFSRFHERGTVRATPEIATFLRPGLTEEYSVSTDGVRQDFLVHESPSGAGELTVDLEITGAKAEAADFGAKLTVNGSGRELAYSRLKVTDATGRELAARMVVNAQEHLQVLVDDSAAAYPVRVDPTFSDANWVSTGQLAGVGGTVNALVLSGTNLYVGGLFADAGGETANNIAKWDGSLWSAVGSGVNGEVLALILSGTDIIAGGFFTAAGGVSANQIARWNGTTWSAVGSGANGGVRALVASGSTIYAGGDFTYIGGIYANRIAKWNGSSWSALGTGIHPGYLVVSATVNALALMGTDLYAGGEFQYAGAADAYCIAKWNGTTWSSVGGQIGGAIYPRVNALAVNGTDLYAAGNFTTIGASTIRYIAKWNGATWSALGSGLAQVVNGTVTSVALAGTNVYVSLKGGDAWTASVSVIMRWNGSTWSALGTGTSGVLAASVLDVYSGDSKWNGSTWNRMGSGIRGGSVSAVAVSGNNLYAATEVSGATSGATSIAKWDGSVWTVIASTIGGGSGSRIYTMVFRGSDLYVGGSFSSVGGVATNNIAKWNGTTWSGPWGVNGLVCTLLVHGSDLYVGGWFTSIAGINASKIAKWNGTTWSSFGSGMSSWGQVNAIAVSESDVYAAGYFTSAGGVDANFIAKWNGTEWLPLGTGLNDNVLAIATSGSDVYVGGIFTRAGGSLASCIAKWNGASWSPLGSGLYGTIGGGNTEVRALTMIGDNLYVGGNFNGVGGVAASCIAKWNGGGWSAIGSGVNNRVWSFAKSATDLYAGGAFSIAGNKVSAYATKITLPSYSDIAINTFDGSNLGDALGSTNMGSVDVGASSALVSFTIRNTGNLNLTLSGITKSGGNTGDFSVDTTGMLGSLTPGGSTAFSVLFTPGAAGARSTTIRVASNDPDENHFDINLIGTGTALSFTTEIAIQQDGSDITNGATKNYEPVTVGATLDLIFTISNLSSADLTLTGTPKVAVDGSSDFTVTAQPTSPITGPSGSSNFTVRFTPTGSGLKSALLTIPNDDDDENPFVINLTGTAVRNPADGIDFPTFTSVPVTVDGFDATGRMVGPLTLGFDPAPGQVLTLVNNTSSYPIEGVFTNLPDGGRIATTYGGRSLLFVANYAGGNGNDLTLTLLDPKIVVESPEGVELFSGGAAVSFGTTPLGTPLGRSFTIKNGGQVDLAVASITLPSGYLLTSPFAPLTLESGEAHTFEVLFLANALNGTFGGIMAIASNSAVNSTFSLNLTSRAIIGGNPAVADVGFNGSGKVSTAIGSGNDFGTSVVVQSDGKVVLAGYASNGVRDNIVLVRYLENGMLDPDFGTSGKVITPLGASHAVALGMAMQSDGKLVVAGYASNGSNNDFAILRFLASGALDPAFGTSGIAMITVGSSEDVARSIVIQGDGRIVVAGDYFSGLNYDFAMVRLDSNGALDPSFGVGGKVTTPIGASTDVCNALALQSDGKIVAAGYYSSSGQNDYAMARYLTNGTLDPNFGSGGKVTVNVGPGDDICYGVVVQTNGRVLLAGRRHNGTNYDLALLGFGSNGTPDTTFGSGGMTLVAFGTGDDFGRALSLQPDESIVVVGEAVVGSNYDIAVARLNGNGTLDPGFGNNGKATMAVGTSNDFGRSLAFANDGKILVGGSTHNGSNMDMAVIRFGAELRPTVATGQGAATGIFSAVLNGTVNPNGVLTNAWFAYRKAGGVYTENAVSPLQALGSGKTPSAVLANLSSLDSMTNYFFRVVAANGEATVTGAEMAFTTPPNSDANLGSLSVTEGSGIFAPPLELEPAFSPAITSYQVVVPQGATEVRLTGLAAYSSATISAIGNMGTPSSLNVTQGLFGSGDPPPYSFNVIAQDGLNFKVYTVNFIRSTVSEIAIEQAGFNISNDSTLSFGAVAAGTTSDLTFTIRNTGNADLALTGSPPIAVNGSSDFTVTNQPFSSITGPSGSSNFIVRFAPTSSGLKTASLSIPNNDGDESPFVIQLTGTALSSTALPLSFHLGTSPFAVALQFDVGFTVSGISMVSPVLQGVSAHQISSMLLSNGKTRFTISSSTNTSIPPTASIQVMLDPGNIPLRDGIMSITDVLATNSSNSPVSASPGGKPIAFNVIPSSLIKSVVGKNISIGLEIVDLDGSITSVLFRLNGSPIGSTSVRPFFTSATSATAGTFAFTAFAQDNAGNSVVSSPSTLQFIDPVALSTYSAFQTAWLDGAGAFTADPYGTGISNGVAWALGINPRNPDRSRLPVQSIEESEGGKILVYQARVLASEVDHQILISTSLAADSWSQLPPAQIEETLEASGWRLIEARVPITDIAPRHFIQLSVENP